MPAELRGARASPPDWADRRRLAAERRATDPPRPSRSVRNTRNNDGGRDYYHFVSNLYSTGQNRRHTQTRPTVRETVPVPDARRPHSVPSRVIPPAPAPLPIDANPLNPKPALVRPANPAQTDPTSYPFAEKASPSSSHCAWSDPASWRSKCSSVAMCAASVPPPPGTLLPPVKSRWPGARGLSSHETWGKKQMNQKHAFIVFAMLKRIGCILSAGQSNKQGFSLFV